MKTEQTILQETQEALIKRLIDNAKKTCEMIDNHLTQQETIIETFKKLTNNYGNNI